MMMTYISQKNYHENSFAFMYRKMTWKSTEILQFHLNYSNSSRNQLHAAIIVGNAVSCKQPTRSNMSMKNGDENDFG